MKLVFIKTVLLLLILNEMYSASNIDWKKKSFDKFAIFYSEKDSNNVHDFKKYLEDGIRKIEGYFGESFLKTFDIYLFPSRKDLDAQWGKDWNIPDFKSECWMVASGVAHRLDILSTDRWKTEACEHNPDDKDHIQKILTHELVHVFHGQNNPVPDFNNLDDIGWLIEGLAVLVSGQLDSNRMKDLVDAKSQDKLPSKLKDGWKGKYRYSVCGSLVDFIEKRFGKAVITELLNKTAEKEILNVLGITEEKFLSEWRTSL